MRSSGFSETRQATYIASRPLQNGTFCPISAPISASGSNFNPRNIQYIPVVEIFTFLELEQKLPFFKGLASSLKNRCALHPKGTSCGAYMELST